MNLVVATIPEDPADLAGWLERRLVGLELDGLVAELAAVHRSAAARPSLEQVLGGKLDQVRESGLSCLSRDQMRQLLTRPLLLLELQEQVLTTGGRYWDQVARTMPMMHLKVEEGRRFLPAEAGASRKPRTATLRPASPVPATTPTTTPKPRSHSTWLACAATALATAAAVLVAVSIWQTSFPATGSAMAWGWLRPGAVKENAAPADYLEGLADAAGEWFKKRPEGAEDAPELARRIGEMRQGCSRLILAAHKPLKEEDRKWLVERCKAWASKFDQALTDLESTRDVLKVRDQMDETVKNLQKALRDRAAQVA